MELQSKPYRNRRTGLFARWSKQILHAKVLLVLIITLCSACNSFLEQRADQRLSVPTTVADFQAMLDNFGNINNDYTAAGEVSAADFYLSDADVGGLGYESDRRLYTWQADFVARPQSSGGDEWYNCYYAVNICNLVLQGMEEQNLSGVQADQVRGHALYVRASRFLDAAQTWCVAYNTSTSQQELGMVLKLDPDPNVPSQRATLEQTYQQIIDDLALSITLLPELQPGKTAPTKTVALAMLARTYLYMGDYSSALDRLNEIDLSSLRLIDFNTLSEAPLYPIPVTTNSSEELLLWSNTLYGGALSISVAKIVPELYDSYTAHDLRKRIYYGANPDGTYFFRGGHTGAMNVTNGISAAEILLMVAECKAQQGDIGGAAEALNQLLVTRYQRANFTPYTFSDRNTALAIIREERRKELVMRALRWPDIKRYNRDGAGITLERVTDGQRYRLPPNDPRYAIAIPEEVIALSNIQQNPR
ncbi:RagB/SusD family nutrient uptake outer membrane protein [Sphingobacterium sp. lm-10]|uniref:RagB/SusD family nutrient uptake outer membrane protein n=1 Tax=Sphingobacterium sp. lm-10 TaxID=2944904 RepID=UPI0020213C39|nr:RagB/SusD family nutrient uptake outer membrane protein [Sphingobacterium sp. lm-10]MCL7987086.1 RagB/SusD family nutrient uptake outer membrane protein [Sphingobacterium sp. lm-10]